MALHSEAVILNVMPFWHYNQKQGGGEGGDTYLVLQSVAVFQDNDDNDKDDDDPSEARGRRRGGYPFGITFRSSDSECNAMLALHPEAVILNACQYYI